MIWRSQDHDFPVEFTGEEYEGEDGRIYARVRTPDGGESVVPKDELIADPPEGEGDGAAGAGDGAGKGFGLNDKPQESEDEALARLAKLPPLEYDRVRKDEAKKRGCRVSALDKLVAGAGGASPPGGGKKERIPQRDRVVKAVLDANVSFWRDDDGEAYASVPEDGHIERYRVRGTAFRNVVRGIYGDAYPSPLGIPGSISDAVWRDVRPQLEAIGFRETVRAPVVRVHRADDGTVWLDLGDPAWRLIAVDATGWRIVESADVPLIRSKGMRPLPVPARDPQALAKWRALLNFNPPADASDAVKARADSSFKLIVVFSLSVLWPRGPYAILVLNGEHGSAKTTACKVVRGMTDPNGVPIRSVPRNPDDLFVTATNSRLMALDNISVLYATLADVLCGIATGTGRGARQLYTDDEEAILGALNPIILNGVENLLTRGDLADRSLSIMLPAISDDDRRDEAEMDTAIAAAAPGILALLLDGLVEAMKNLPTLKLDRKPRMADFAKLACAAAPAFGWKTDEVFQAIMDNRKLAIEAVIAADPVATALLEMLDGCTTDNDGYLWTGTATELLARLCTLVPPDTVKSKDWPKTADSLSRRIKRAQPALRSSGLEITQRRTNRSRGIAIKAASKGQNASPASPRHFANLFNGVSGDANGDASLDGPSSRVTGAEEVTRVTPMSFHASPLASPQDDAQDYDNAEENLYGDARDARDADSPLLASLDDDDDDEEGEI